MIKINFHKIDSSALKTCLEVSQVKLKCLVIPTVLSLFTILHPSTTPALAASPLDEERAPIQGGPLHGFPGFWVRFSTIEDICEEARRNVMDEATALCIRNGYEGADCQIILHPNPFLSTCHAEAADCYCFRSTGG